MIARARRGDARPDDRGVPRRGGRLRDGRADAADASSFEESATLDLGGRQVELRYLGRGHTDNDIVDQSCPTHRSCSPATCSRTPRRRRSATASRSRGPTTGRALLALVSGTVVPGHGDPFDRGFAERQVARAGGACGAGARGGGSGAIGLDEAIRRSPFPARRDRTGARTRPAGIGVSKLTHRTE